MTNHIVTKLNDQKIIQLLYELSDKLGGSIQIFVGASVDKDNIEKLQSRRKASYFITKAIYKAPDSVLNVQIPRTHAGQANAYYDDIILHIDPNRGATINQIFAVNEIIENNVKLISPQSIRNPSDELTVLQTEIAGLAELHQKMVADTSELRQKLESDYTEQRSMLEQRRTRVLEELAEAERQSAERISAEEAQLAERLAEVDASDHMFARRKLREDITLEIRESLARPVSSIQSSYKLLLVTVGSVAAIGGCVYLAFESFESFISLANSSTVDLADLLARAGVQAANVQMPASVPRDNSYLLWLMAIRGFLLSAVAIGFTYYLVSMFRTSFDEDIRSLRELQRYGMDINRASWVIETAMEMTTKEDATLPERWIEGATAGLFQVGSNKESEVTSLSALGAVMGLGPEVSIGPEGAQFKLSPKAAKKAAADRE
ncbi:hypothetical protein [Rhizobium leguminosarum]|uniref:hypothetical protein n=1 Tax=Rhizobium leguminosarum TaxID=384 RepID=UPI00143F20AE|nr:hypothetical protein [Rhizobium leguminosarum]NKL23097.1 hypothetical protein [Rhizobium leguminosarum bv. viciae]